MSDEFKPKTEEEIRAEVVADLKGEEEEFDEEANADKIARITQRRLKDEEFKASVHTQKSEKSKKVEDLEKEIAELKKPKGENQPLDDTKLTEKIKELREEEFLEELDYSDEIKGEIKTLAKVKGVSVKKALNEPYIQSRIKDEEEKKKADDASLNNSKKGRANVDPTKRTYNPANKEDREAFAKLTPEQKIEVAKNQK